MNQKLFCLFLTFTLVTVVNCFTAQGDAKPTCSLIGTWKPNPDLGFPAANRVTFLANGTTYGVITDTRLPAGQCNFRGLYSVSSLDGFFTWNVSLIDCAYTGPEAFDITSQTFCQFIGPTYTWASSDLHFTVGCFAAFISDCTNLQFSLWNGHNGGASGLNNWVIDTRNVPSSKTVKPNFGPQQCSINNTKTSTIPQLSNNYPFLGYTDTLFNITYDDVGGYVSRATHTPTDGSPSCFVEWTGSFTLGARNEAYPEVALYPYSTDSVVTTQAPAGSYCEGYSLDPASCEYLYSGSYVPETCFIAWDYFPNAQPCTFFRFIDAQQVPSPTFFVIERKEQEHHGGQSTHKTNGGHGSRGNSHGGHSSNSHGRGSRHHGDDNDHSGHHTGGNGNNGHDDDDDNRSGHGNNDRDDDDDNRSGRNGNNDRDDDDNRSGRNGNNHLMSENVESGAVQYGIFTLLSVTLAIVLFMF